MGPSCFKEMTASWLEACLVAYATAKSTIVGLEKGFLGDVINVIRAEYSKEEILRECLRGLHPDWEELAHSKLMSY